MGFERLDLYTAAGAEFNAKTGADEIHDDRGEGFRDKARVVDEEVKELLELTEPLARDDVYWDRDEEAKIAEEMADVVYTIMTMAHAMDIDIHGAFMAKHRYNIQKSGGTVEDGKVVDDAGIEKPDFEPFVWSGE
jgi:NTP pyrophosphatase (non-canonical NTP hydrolase)